MGKLPDICSKVVWHSKAKQSLGILQLIAQDRHDDARHILLALLPSKKTDEDFVNREMAEIQHAIDEEREAAHGSSYKALLKNGPQKFFYRTMLGIGGQFMQQLSYVYISSFSPFHRWIF